MRSEVVPLALALPVKIFAFFAGLLVLQSFAALRDGFRFLNFVRKSFRQSPPHFFPETAVIIPCKGTDPGFESNLTSYLTQDYPGYQLIFAVASENDPACARLRARLKALKDTPSPGPVKAKLVVAGFSEERGEKVNNLLRALSAVDPQTKVLVFADADARPGRDWLRSLVGPLRDPGVTVSTGFRWYLPGEGFVSQLRAAWDTSIATLLGDHTHNFAWGGSMAVRARDFERLEVAGFYWAHTVSDDYAVTRAVRNTGGRIRFEPRCLVASREESSFREFLRWADRQIIITRVYAAHLWALGLAAQSLYAGTLLFGLALAALPGPPAVVRSGIAMLLLVMIGVGMAKGYLRTVVAREIFPEEAQTLKRLGSRYWQLQPLVPWIMLFNFLMAGFCRRIEWGGAVYRLWSADKVEVVSRSGR